MTEDNKNNNVEKETKKLEEFKNSDENKKIISEQTNQPSKSAVEKVSKKSKEKKEILELEREYIVPLKKGTLNVPRYKRAKKAIRTLKEFIVKHMKIYDRDLSKVKIDKYLNEEIWFRGIKKPANKIKVKAKKIDGIVYVEFAELPETLKYKKAREEKRTLLSESKKSKKPKKVEEKVEENKDKDNDGVDDKKEESEDRKSEAKMDVAIEKSIAKEIKHSTKGAHAKKSMPVRKVMK